MQIKYTTDLIIRGTEMVDVKSTKAGEPLESILAGIVHDKVGAFLKHNRENPEPAKLFRVALEIPLDD